MGTIFKHTQPLFSKKSVQLSRMEVLGIVKESGYLRNATKVIQYKVTGRSY
jgi:hypothetical protein